MTHVTKWDVNRIASNICRTIVYFDLLNSTVNNDQATDRFLTFSSSILYIYFLSVALRSVFRSWLLLSRSFDTTLRHSTLGRIPGRVIILWELHLTTYNIQNPTLGEITTPISASEQFYVPYTMSWTGDIRCAFSHKNRFPNNLIPRCMSIFI
jgi:hypothetical protein